MFNFMRVLLACFVLFSGGAFANTTYYRVDTLGTIGETPLAACMKLSNYLRYTPSEQPTGNVVGVCVTKQPNGMTGVSYNVRSQTSDCNDGETFDIELAQCVPEPNQCGSELTTIKWTIGKLDSAFNVVETNGSPPSTMCISSCLYGAPSMEDVFNGGQYEGSPVWANVDYRGFNESCTPGDGSGGDGSGDGDGDGSGDGDGDGNGDGNGDNDTPPDTPKPDDPEPSEAEGPAKESTTEDIKNKLDNLAQEHTQQDIKNRLDKVAKESTQKEISSKLDGLAKDSSLGSLGDKIGESNSLLQGIKDAIGEIPNSGGSSNPGDDGEEEEEQSSVTGGDKCDNPPFCTGDAIQCAILDQQYITRCNAEDLYDYEKHKDEIEQLVTGSKFELQDTSIVEMSSFVTGHTRWLSSTCPADETMSLRTNGGRTFSLSYLPLCNAADAIAPLIVIIATLLATLYVGRGAGG